MWTICVWEKLEFREAHSHLTGCTIHSFVKCSFLGRHTGLNWTTIALTICQGYLRSFFLWLCMFSLCLVLRMGYMNCTGNGFFIVAGYHIEENLQKKTKHCCVLWLSSSTCEEDASQSQPCKAAETNLALGQVFADILTDIFIISLNQAFVPPHFKTTNLEWVSSVKTQWLLPRITLMNCLLKDCHDE